MSNFVVPLDVVRKLGGGDVATGMAALRDTFGLSLDEPLGQIPADTVEAVGGRSVLQKFIGKVRSQRAPGGRA